MLQNSGKRVVMPAGIELTLEAEKHVVLNQTMSILSVGSGTGELEAYLAKKYGCQVIGIDLSTEFVTIAQEMVRKNGQSSTVSFEKGDGRHLRFQDESFDMVFACGSLSEFFDEGVAEITRVLKKGGKVVIIDTALMGRSIPENLVADWLRKEVRILNLEDATALYRKMGLEVVLSRAYYEPSWWDVYYSSRENSSFWDEEYKRYLKYREHIAIALYILSKDPDYLII